MHFHSFYIFLLEPFLPKIFEIEGGGQPVGMEAEGGAGQPGHSRQQIARGNIVGLLIISDFFGTYFFVASTY